MFVRAEKGAGLSVIYHRNDGAKLNKWGGTSAWRNSNPGNIRSSKFAKKNGSIGEVNGFAVFLKFRKGPPRARSAASRREIPKPQHFRCNRYLCTSRG